MRPLPSFTAVSTMFHGYLLLYKTYTLSNDIIANTLCTAYLCVPGTVQIADVSIKPWCAQNDVVLGGMWSGERELTGEGPQYQVALSLLNNGGYS